MKKRSNPVDAPKCLLTSGNWCAIMTKLGSPLQDPHNERDTTRQSEPLDAAGSLAHLESVPNPGVL